jgi:hypothetical protein
MEFGNVGSSDDGVNIWNTRNKIGLGLDVRLID